MSKHTHDVLATIGKYTDREGNEKNRYHKMGIALTQDDGRMSIKLESIPVGPEWSGWANLYPKREDGAGQGGQGGAQGSTYQQRPAATYNRHVEDNIPF